MRIHTSKALFLLLTISIKESIFKHSKPYKWDESNSICTHADSKGTSEFLCLLIAGVRGALAKTIKKIEPHYPFMGEMLADCFCGESETGLSKLGFDEDYHRTDFRMLEFIQQAVLEKIDDDEFVDKFVKKEFYLTEYNED